MIIFYNPGNVNANLRIYMRRKPDLFNIIRGWEQKRFPDRFAGDLMGFPGYV